MKVLVLQTRSKVALANFSLSVDVRIAEFMDYLQKKDKIEYAVCLADDPIVTKLLNWCDVILISKSFGEQEIEIAKLAKEKHKAVILDIDDYIFGFPKYSNWRSTKHDPSAKITAIKTYVDAVAVENINLFKEMTNFHTKCIIIPNGLFFEKHTAHIYTCCNASNRYVFTTTDSLKFSSFRKDFLDVLVAFHKRYKHMVMDFYGDSIPEIHKLPFVRWMPRVMYRDYLASLSANRYCFAITPLGGDEDKDDVLFHSCKSPIKYINYGFAKIPGIYSDVAIYRSAIKNNVTGLLVKNTYDAWYGAMCEMTENQTLRDNLRDAAYKDTYAEYNIAKSTGIYLDLLCKVTAAAKETV